VFLRFLFVLFALAGHVAVVAQNVPAADSLAIAVADTVAVAGLFPDDFDIIDADTIVVQTRESPFQFRITYKATDSVKFNMMENRVYMYMETQVNYDDMELQAYKTEFDMASRIVYATGGRDSISNYFGAPVFKQRREEFETDSMLYSFQTGQAILYNIKTQQGEGFLHADISKRFSAGYIFMRGGIYTTCERDHPHFGLRLSKAKVIPGDQTVFGPAYLEVLDIPFYFFALPFGFFPQIDKESVSGIIPPTINMEITKGMSLTGGGYYFAFNDHFDAQITGDIWSTGSWQATLITRYILRYKFASNLNMNYGVSVYGDKGFDLARSKQYSVQWSHRQDAKAHPYQTFNATIDYKTSSYDKEFNFTSMDVYNNSRSSSMSFSRKWPNTPFHFSTNFNVTQTSSNGMTTASFPNFTFRMDRIYPFRKKESVGKPRWYEDISLQYDARFQNSFKGHEDDLFNEKNFKNMINGFEHRIPFSKNFKVLRDFNITPSLNYHGVIHTSRINKTFYPDTLVGTRQGIILVDTIRGLSYAHTLSPSLSFSTTPKFFLTNTYGPNSKVEAIRTVISPTVGISYTPDMNRFFNYRETIDVWEDQPPHNYFIYEGQGAFRVSSSQRGKSAIVNIGVTGNVEMKVRSDSIAQSRKVKLLNMVSARTSYDIFRDTMKWSNIALSANTTLFGLNLQAGGTVNPYKLTSLGTRIDKFGPQLINASFNTGISLPLNRDNNNNNNRDESRGDANDAYSYFDVPWNVSFNYGLNYGYNDRLFEGKITHTLGFSGNINFTKKWSFNFSSHYDFDAKKISQMNANIRRDLCCWEMSISFSPFGAYKHYMFQINAKSNTLRDLKYDRKKTSSDFMRSGW